MGGRRERDTRPQGWWRHRRVSIQAEQVRDELDRKDLEGLVRRYGRHLHVRFRAGAAQRLKRRGHRPMTRFKALELAVDRLVRSREARYRREERRDRDRRERFGRGEMAVVTWAAAVVAVFLLDLVIGRSLVGLVLLDETDNWVLAGAVAMAAYVYAVGHLLGGAVRRWVDHDDGGRRPPDLRSNRRMRAGLGFLAVYLVSMTVIVFAAHAGIARWALGLSPAAAGAVVQAARPEPEAFSYLTDLVVGPWTNLRERWAERTARRRLKRFQRAWGRIGLAWVADGLRAEGILIRWWLANEAGTPDGDTTRIGPLERELQGALAQLGVAPHPDQVAEVLARMAGPHFDPTLNGHWQPALPFETLRSN